MSQPRGEYTVTHLRPKADSIGQFMPLWDARNLAIQYGALLHSALLALPQNCDEHERKKLVQDVASCRMEEDRLTEAMLPYQEQIGAAETFPNIVTTVGKNDLLDKYLKGAAYTQTIVMGLKGTGVAVAADTQASHASWLEQGGANAPTYTAPRKSVTMGNAASGVSTSPTQAFAITSTGTVFGCFINNGGSTTIDNTTGVLFSAGDFTGGSKAVVNLDTLNVVYTLTAT